MTVNEDPRPAPVWGRDDLTCPLPDRLVRARLRHAFDHPWRGDTPLTCPAHRLATTAITEPGRAVRLLLSVDIGYHQSGWFANSDYEQCLHLSVSHPRPDRLKVHPAGMGNAPVPSIGVEAPTDDEVRSWGRVFFRDRVSMTWLEPPADVFDPYRSPGVAHLRLYLDRAGQPMTPRGEVYHLRPWDDGTSPAKVTDGRLGGDVR